MKNIGSGDYKIERHFLRNPARTQTAARSRSRHSRFFELPKSGTKKEDKDKTLVDLLEDYKSSKLERDLFMAQ